MPLVLDLSSSSQRFQWTRPVPAASVLGPSLNLVRGVSTSRSALGLAFALAFTFVRELSRLSFVCFLSIAFVRLGGCSIRTPATITEL